MSGHVQDEGGLVEQEGINAGPPVDGGPPPGEPDEHELAGEHTEAGPAPDPERQGSGELLSRPGSDNGVTHGGPGQEMSAGEG